LVVDNVTEEVSTENTPIITLADVFIVLEEEATAAAATGETRGAPVQSHINVPSELIEVWIKARSLIHEAVAD